jgi:NADH:ubiquinone oxidoreductase subunit C
MTAEPEKVITDLEFLLGQLGLEGEEGGAAVERALDEISVRVPVAALRQVLEAMKDKGFDLFVFVTAVDHPESDELRLVYRLGDLAVGAQVFVTADVPRRAPEVPSVADLWPAADWHEREAMDLLGVTFTDHPNPQTLVLWEGFEGHPLRKDFEDPSMERRPDYI